MRELEAKGIVRTAVESTLLSLHADHPDVLMAECIRAFPSITFPASSLLKREEVETGKMPGASIIEAIYHGHGRKNALFKEPPFDLMYGFRGVSYNVDLLSPYEMLLHWSLERISPPTSSSCNQRAIWTTEGLLFNQRCREEQIRDPSFCPGKHYVANLECHTEECRILMPLHKALGNLRHCWCWEKRSRLHLPAWSYSKIPSCRFSPEENSRL